MVLGLLLNKQQNKQETLNRWRGRTDEGAIRPVTRRARLLPARCARCTRCARCGVSWHRIDLGVNRNLICNFMLVMVITVSPITFEILMFKARKWIVLSTPSLFDAPAWGTH